MTNAQATFLDMLRGFAAQMVLVGHIYSTVYVGSTLGIGDLGVIVFFILSGFLISYSAQVKSDRGSYNLNDFLRDRFFRIFVPYVPILFFVLALDSFVFSNTNSTQYIEHYTIKDFLATLTMLQQYPVGLFFDQILGWNEMKLATFGSARPWWTVAVEWWLYATFGLIIFSSIGRRNPASYLLLLLIVAIVPLFNMVAGTGQGLSMIWFAMATLAWVYLRWGKLAEQFLFEGLLSGIRGKLLLALILVTIVCLIIVRFFWISYIEPGFVFDKPIFYDFNIYVLMVLFISLVYLLLGNIEKVSRSCLWGFVADYSYSLYLVHYSLIYLFYSLELISADNWFSLFLCYLACNMTAIILYFLFERHYKQLQKYYEHHWVRKRNENYSAG